MRQVVEIDVRAPAGEIWPVLAAVEEWPRWTPTMRSVRLLDDDRLRLGTRARIRQPGLPPLTWVVDELVPHQGFSWTTGFPGARTRGTHHLTPAEGGVTRVVLAVRQTGLAAAFGWLTRRWTRRALDLEAASLRRWCEQTAGR